MGFWVLTYGLNFCYDFFETLFEDRKNDKLCGNIIFFQSVLGNKSYAQISSKQGRGGNKKKVQKYDFFLEFLEL